MMTVAQAANIECCVEGCGRYITPDGKPQLQVITRNHPITERGFEEQLTIVPGQTRYCSGPKCAGWRWLDQKPHPKQHATDTRIDEVEPERPKDLPKSWTFYPFDGNEGMSAGWREPDKEALRRATGYCGRAGRP